ncbi:MAG: tetratricopeptide repeat protein [Planctomycetaceae bacterium]|nr:tetratricopeptide repeat protein [Planctomycetaceae bacterium]
MNDAAHTPAQQTAESTRPKSTARRSGLLICGIVLVTIVTVTATAWKSGWFETPRPLPKGITQDQFDKALQDFRGLFQKEPTHDDALMLLAESAIRREQWEKAVACLTEIPSDHDRYGLSARLQEAQAFLRLNRAVEAERSFLGYLKLAEQHPENETASKENQAVARQWLTFLYAVELRFEDRHRILRGLEKSGIIDIYEAKQLYFPSLLIWHSNLGSERLSQYLLHDPDDLVLNIAAARYMTHEGKPQEAKEQLESLLANHPADKQLIAALLEALREMADDDEFARRVAELPAFEQSDPWLLTLMRAEGALLAHDWSGAEKYLRAVLEADPASPAAHMGLGRSLTEQGRLEESKRLQERSLRLAKIRVTLSEVNRVSADAALELADHAEQLEMADAAATFRRLAASMQSTNEQGAAR